MKFYDMSKPLYLETDASVIGLRTGHLQVRDGMNCRWDEVPDNTALCPTAFTNKNLSSVKWQYSKIEWEVIGMLHGLEKLHHYCFAKEINITTNHKPLVAIVSKENATLSQWLQCIMLHIHQNCVKIFYKCGPALYMANWLSQDVGGMSINIHTLSTAIDILVSTQMEDIRTAMSEDAELKKLQTHILSG